MPDSSVASRSAASASGGVALLAVAAELDPRSIRPCRHSRTRSRSALTTSALAVMWAPGLSRRVARRCSSRSRKRCRCRSRPRRTESTPRVCGRRRRAASSRSRCDLSGGRCRLESARRRPVSWRAAAPRTWGAAWTPVATAPPRRASPGQQVASVRTAATCRRGPSATAETCRSSREVESQADNESAPITMLRIFFTGDDVARTRLAPAPDPLWETVLSLHILRSQRANAAHGEWRRSVATDLQASPLMSDLRMLLALNPSTGYFPDFSPRSPARMASMRVWTRWPRPRRNCSVATSPSSRRSDRCRPT